MAHMVKCSICEYSFDRDKIVSALQKMGLDENIRGEKLSIEKFGELSELLK